VVLLVPLVTAVVVITDISHLLHGVTDLFSFQGKGKFHSLLSPGEY